MKQAVLSTVNEERKKELRQMDEEYSDQVRSVEKARESEQI